MANDFAKTENQILAMNFGDAEKQWIFIPMFWYGLREIMAQPICPWLSLKKGMSLEFVY